jgi:hypothetical protein
VKRTQQFKSISGLLEQRAPVIDDRPRTLVEITIGMLGVQMNAALLKVREILPNYEDTHTLALYPRNVDVNDLMITQVAHLRDNTNPVEIPEGQVKKILGTKVIERTPDGWFFQLRVGLKGLGYDEELVGMGLIPDPKVVAIES